MGQLHPQLSTHVLPRLLDALAVANGAHCRKISVAPQQVSQSRRNQSLECSSGAFGGTLSVPSPTTQHRARTKRGDAPDFVEGGEAGIAMDDAMRRQRRVQLAG